MSVHQVESHGSCSMEVDKEEECFSEENSMTAADSSLQWHGCQPGQNPEDDDIILSNASENSDVDVDAHGDRRGDSDEGSRHENCGGGRDSGGGGGSSGDDSEGDTDDDSEEDTEDDSNGSDDEEDDSGGEEIDTEVEDEEAGGQGEPVCQEQQFPQRDEGNGRRIIGDGDDSDHDPDDPDGPDDPDRSEGSSHNSSSGSENEDEANFSFNNPKLDTIIRNNANLTIREVMALLVSVSVKENWTFISFIRVCRAFNVIFGRKYLPQNKQRLWKYLDRKFFGLKKMYYCMKCRGPLRKPRDNEPEDMLICTNDVCGTVVRQKRAKYWFKLSLEKQFAHFQSFPAARQVLNYPQTRQKKVPDGLEDTIDGQKCREMQQEGNPLHSENNFSFKVNTDAFYISKSKTRTWPIFVKLDQLPPNLRQKHMFLAGVFVDSHDPIMSDFFDPVVNDMNRLSRTGIPWRQEEGLEVQSHFHPSAFVTDAMARCEVLNMNPPTGYYGCTLCRHPGVYANGAVRFPIWPPVVYPELRTDAGIKEDMVTATEEGRVVNGVKGACALMNLDHFDLAKDVPIDDLHPFFLGAIRQHIDLLYSRDLISPANERIINRRLRNIRSPTFITRKPRPLSKRKKYNGSEWRNFALYYMVPCFEGIIPNRYFNHLQLLAKALFLVCKEGVREEELNAAEICFRDYVIEYELLFGRESMTFTIHVLLHAVACVRRFGPFYCQSTFGFESWNHRLMKTIKCGKKVCDQIVTRFLMAKFSETIYMHPLIRPEVKREVEHILNERRQRFVLVDGIYLLGKARRRAPNADERFLLENEGLRCNVITEFKRAIYQTMEYRCSSYTHDGERGLSDNSNILTWDDEFCSISSIILIEVGDVRSVRLVVKVFNTPNSMNIADYISNVVPGDDIYISITFPQIFSHAVKIITARGSYIMPITNPYEID